MDSLLLLLSYYSRIPPNPILFFKAPILTDAVENAQEQMNDEEVPETTSTTDLIQQDVNGLGFKLH